jgi:Anti-sigma factor NepR
MAKKQQPGDGKTPPRNRPETTFDPVTAALRQLYEEIAAEEIPDDFIKLLDRLEEKSPKAGRE